MTTIRLWQIEDRGQSIKFSTAPPERDGRQVFIGRSIIEHISRNLALPNGWIPCVVKLEDWLIEKGRL